MPQSWQVNKNDKLAILFDEWTKCDGKWSASKLIYQMRTTDRFRKTGSRRWMTEREIELKFQSAEIASDIVKYKEECCKNQIRDHPDCPGLQQYLITNFDEEVDERDEILESLFTVEDGSDNEGPPEKPQSKKKDAKDRKSKKRRRSPSSSSSDKESTSPRSLSSSASSESVKSKGKKAKKKNPKRNKTENKSKGRDQDDLTESKKRKAEQSKLKEETKTRKQLEKEEEKRIKEQEREEKKAQEREQKEAKREVEKEKEKKRSKAKKETRACMHQVSFECHTIRCNQGFQLMCACNCDSEQKGMCNALHQN